MRRLLMAGMLAVTALAALMTAAGCGSETLETGYEPRKLGASDSARRGFYAPQFSPAGQAAAAADREHGGGYDATMGAGRSFGRGTRE